MLVIDPPDGWLYGFPKVFNLDEEKGENLETWLVDNGYPLHKVAIALRYSRYWDTVDA